MQQQSLQVGDVILFEKKKEKNIGTIRYIGLMHGLSPINQYVGIELLESKGIYGHNGSLKGYSYFNVKNGYGEHCELRDVIKKLTPIEMFAVCKAKLMRKNEKIKTLKAANKHSIFNQKKRESIAPLKSFTSTHTLLSHGFEPITPLSPELLDTKETNFDFDNVHAYDESHEQTQQKKANPTLQQLISLEPGDHDDILDAYKQERRGQKRKWKSESGIDYLKIDVHSTDFTIHSLENFRMAQSPKTPSTEMKSLDEIIKKEIAPMTPINEIDDDALAIALSQKMN